MTQSFMLVHRSNSHEPLGKFDMVSNNQGSVHLWAQMKHEMAFGANPIDKFGHVAHSAHWWIFLHSTELKVILVRKYQ